MGRFADELLCADDGFNVTDRLDRDSDLAEALHRSEARVALDFTVAGLGLSHGMALLESGIRPVIGTSGVSADQTAALDAEARRLGLGGLVVPNFSLGMWALQRAAELAAQHLPSAAIVELHHEHKVDSPSGTSLHTRELLGAKVPIHSVRLPGLYAHQEVILGGPGETLTLRHDMHGPQAFGPGIIAALRYAACANGVGRGLGLALDLPASG